MQDATQYSNTAPLSADESFSHDDFCVDLVSPHNLPTHDVSFLARVSTKKDGDVSTNKAGDHADAKSSCMSNDAFLYYSDDRNRMKALKLEDDEAASTERVSNQCERKTRLSFELHPSLILDDMLDELFSEDESNDIGFGWLECGDDPKMDLLAQLLQI
mmetsp:Transcript_28464/g.60298  ORF Transcript_28464/g.60298 Transcript_28464/m.60298 type:complete len:159 (-) Transcript_28464:221-697(-)|eukprot:CAMPEP_0172551978 /NCGR_PEP_ID=MMETSP1067-20121228/42903_1 /TAXON_ID=265564 ORGANISM="Thalassiosira punctigera, Strain Tpunct2005C2" /NCGR_SAMPLE_ID=MMETSP1067 /ASSEMBLY_ACC=CAM_ASM_000444 /LENGTH=158 /DNA_ID=CAMNT_0013339869 /DNA_START=86 /DNA_END=562 /DNA_ORIENTATION=+